MNDFDKEVEQNLPLVSYVLQKYYHKWDEDMFQTGCLGLIKAVKTFNPNKNINKSTYYTSCIKNEIGSVGRRNNTKKRGKDFVTISLNTEIKKHDNLELQDLIPNDENVENTIVKNEMIALLYELIDTLPDRDKIIIIFSFGLFDYDKKNQCEIAKIVGINQASVSRCVKRMLCKLKGKMTNDMEKIEHR